MVCCSAPNCSNSSSKGYRLFRFPSDNSRLAIWLQNCRRDKWKPTSTSRLCEVHFESSEWESKRKDGWKKLKPNAIPTIFNVPNPPKKLENIRVSSYKIQNSTTEDSSVAPHRMIENSHSLTEEPDNINQQQTARLKELENEVAALKEELNKKQSLIKTFLNEEQMSALVKTPTKWSSESIILGLKLRFSLGIHGYNYLRTTGYPIPSISTLNKRLKHIKIDFGIFEDLKEPLKCKVETMEPLDRICSLSIDEMEISGNLDFDKNKGMFFGNVTLGDKDIVGNHLTVVLIRGVKNAWKQVIACEVTSSSTRGVAQKGLIERCLAFTHECGLEPISVTSDMGSNNRAMWNSLGVNVDRLHRQTAFNFNGSNIHTVPDVCHLLKNLKNCLLNTGLHLPQSVVESEGLLTTSVSGSHIKELWEKEVKEKKEVRLLHHLSRNDLDPNHFYKMNVGSSVRFFSIKTAAALELAVKFKMLQPEALSTAFFCRLVQQWFAITSSKISKAAITIRNKQSRFSVLHRFVDLFQGINIGKCWKPLNTGIIMATLSLIFITEKLLSRGYKFVLLHRFTQDALENIFSQIRRKSGSCPSALQSLRSLKMILVSQFVSDVKRTNYSSDSDKFLVDSEVLKTDKRLPNKNNCYGVEKFFTVTSTSESQLDVVDHNVLYNLGGSAINAVSDKCCSSCRDFLLDHTEVEDDVGTYVDFLSLGYLKKPNQDIFNLILNCEILFQRYYEVIKKKSNNELKEKIVRDIEIAIPTCCNLKTKIVDHFFTVRSYCVVNFRKETKKKRSVGYGSSCNKKTRY